MSDSLGLPVHQLHVAAERIPAASGRTYTVTNPTTGELWGAFADAGHEDVDRAVLAAARAFADPAWRGLSPTRRGRLLMRFGDLLAEHADELGLTETHQNGKLYREMYAQASTVPEWLYYYGGLADKIEGAVVPLDRQTVFNYTLREPLGVIGVITPWNSPLLLTTMAVAPALAAGNTVVIKPSEFTPASLLRFGEIADAAGLPPGVVNVVSGGREAGEALVAHAGVAGISFTGSTAAGRAIAQVAGARLAHVGLELGGKSPNIVFADAELDAVEAGVVAGIFAAGGQSCIAGSRLLVERDIQDQLVERLVGRARAIVLGDPTQPETQMGPVATLPQLEKIESIVERARADGATVRAGGRRSTLPAFPKGLFYEPTIVAGVENDSFICQEEIFGPVLAVVPFSGEEEAVALANGTRYGLAAGVWTRDVKRAHRVARALQAGTVWINLYRGLTYNSPFGGVKESGIGRANGINAIDAYLQTKSVWCELSEEIQDPFVLKL